MTSHACRQAPLSPVASFPMTITAGPVSSISAMSASPFSSVPMIAAGLVRAQRITSAWLAARTTGTANKDPVEARTDFGSYGSAASPGNIGTLIRSADAFGAHGLIVTGHAADPYDPKSVRASTGSLFAVPVVRAASHADVIRWARTRPATIIGTDEKGETDIADIDLTGPAVIVFGNEATGLSEAWRQACDVIARIPITGAASSLNAAGAATVVLYEAARQRRAPVT